MESYLDITRNHRIHAVVAIIQRANTFLFVKRSDYTEASSGYWCPVSGRIEKNETQEDALKREVMEEVCVDVDAVAVEKIGEIPSPDGQFFCITGELRLPGVRPRYAAIKQRE